MRLNFKTDNVTGKLLNRMNHELSTFNSFEG